MSKVCIGMPVYNGEKFISKAVQSIIDQSHTDWEMLISDNNSSDQTQAICESFATRDARITYTRQKINLGVGGNFLFLLNAATSDYFMWAAADDLWDRDFIAKCFPPLIERNDVALSFCNIKSIDSFGRVINEIASFNRFVHSNKEAQIASYILDPEFLGKANLIYGIYNLSLSGAIMKAFLKKGMDLWGADVALVLGVLLSPHRLHINESYLFFKRIANPEDSHFFKKKVLTEFPTVHGIPLEDRFYLPYYKLLNETAASTKYEPLVAVLTKFRLELSVDLARFKEKIQIQGDEELQSLGIKNLFYRLTTEVRKKIKDV